MFLAAVVAQAGWTGDPLAWKFADDAIVCRNMGFAFADADHVQPWGMFCESLGYSPYGRHVKAERNLSPAGFFYYALADGIQKLFTRFGKWSAKLDLKKVLLKPSPQLEFAFVDGDG